MKYCKLSQKLLYYKNKSAIIVSRVKEKQKNA